MKRIGGLLHFVENNGIFSTTTTSGGLTWSASKPKYLRVSKNLRVAASVKGLVIIYQWIGTVLLGPASYYPFEGDSQSKQHTNNLKVYSIKVITFTRLSSQLLNTQNPFSLELEK
jgi:hypothetical protein